VQLGGSAIIREEIECRAMNPSGICPTSSQVGPRLDERACRVSRGALYVAEFIS